MDVVDMDFWVHCPYSGVYGLVMMAWFIVSVPLIKAIILI